MKNFFKEAQSIEGEIIRWRRYLHENPEIGCNLPKTVTFVTSTLEKMGYSPKLTSNNGIVAVLDSENGGKTLLLRADMDALPIMEETDLPFKSKNKDASHSCGHDNHTAMLLGAAKILMDNKHLLKGRVKFVFEPDEETTRGAKSMIDDGILENPQVDAAMAFHSMVGKFLNTGQVAYSRGPAMASADIFEITVEGKATHGASPEFGVDPINIMSHIQIALNTILSREKPQKEPVVLNIGMFNAGNVPNAIPNKASMSGTLRTFDQFVREKLKNRIIEISTGIAKSFGGNAKVEFKMGTPAVINDLDVGDEIVSYVKEVIGNENVIDFPSAMGSEDFSEVLLRVPGVFLWIGMGSISQGYNFGMHNPKAIFNEEGLVYGSALFAHCAVKWLENNFSR
ncbi:TPA: amidohydrolase [Clostridioides difficile]|nr:amidohydrolase [Clostridioides difficile]HBZ0374161.1 amidohydrolase [Clostridioides difficile]